MSRRKIKGKGGVLTTAEVLVGTSLLVRDCALVGLPITDVTELAAALDAGSGRTVCPVGDN